MEECPSYRHGGPSGYGWRDRLKTDPASWLEGFSPRYSLQRRTVHERCVPAAHQRLAGWRRPGGCPRDRAGLRRELRRRLLRRQLRSQLRQRLRHLLRAVLLREGTLVEEV